MTDMQIENEIQAKGLNAPRITPKDIQQNIVAEYYFTAGDGYAGALTVDADAMSNCPVSDDGVPMIHVPSQLDLLTFCVLVLKNGFTVTGESACASPENFDKEIGQKIARENAINKVWPLMGYELKQRLFNAVEE